MGRPVELRTERLLLRPFTMGDVEDVLEYGSDQEWSRYLINIPQPFTRKDAETFVKRYSDLTSWNSCPVFAAVVEGRVIGEVYLTRLDMENERAEIGFDLSQSYWGQGLATEAANKVMDWGFRTYKLNKIIATCDQRNERSKRVIERLGMKREGQLRSHLKWNGEFRDQLYYGILRSEWER